MKNNNLLLKKEEKGRGSNSAQKRYRGSNTLISTKGEMENKKCDRCGKGFRRRKSIWNTFILNTFCSDCEKSYNKWWKEGEELKSEVEEI